MLVLWPAVGAEGASLTECRDGMCTPGERTTGCRDSIGGGVPCLYKRTVCTVRVGGAAPNRCFSTPHLDVCIVTLILSDISHKDKPRGENKNAQTAQTVRFRPAISSYLELDPLPLPLSPPQSQTHTHTRHRRNRRNTLDTEADTHATSTLRSGYAARDRESRQRVPRLVGRRAPINAAIAD